MIEVDRSREIICHVSLIDDVAPQGRVVATVSRNMTANCPGVFKIGGLAVNQRYKVSFSGICRRDAEERTGQFKTFDTLSPHFRAVAVANDNPQSLRLGDPNVWESIAARVASYEVDAILHLGGQVHASQAFKDALVLFQRHEQTGFVSSGQHEVEEVTRERLRDVYRSAWNLPRKRAVLSSCSNLMIWSDKDVFEDFTTAQDARGDPISPDMIRLAHQVYREYQRQLWDPDCIQGGPATYRSTQAQRRSQALFDAVQKRKQTEALAASGKAKGSKTGEDDEEDDELALEETDPPAQEHHFHKFGNAGVLFVDMRGGKLLEKGGQALEGS